LYVKSEATSHFHLIEEERDNSKTNWIGVSADMGGE